MGEQVVHKVSNARQGRLAVDADGHIYTANFWEEAAQDFRKVDRDTGNLQTLSRGARG